MVLKSKSKKKKFKFKEFDTQLKEDVAFLTDHASNDMHVKLIWDR